MRIPDYRNVHGVKDFNHWTTKTSRVDRAHKDEFEKELENSIYKRKSEAKRKRKNPLTPDEELVEMQLEVDHLFTEYEQKVKWETDIDLDEEMPNNGARFSSCG